MSVAHIPGCDQRTPRALKRGWDRLVMRSPSVPVACPIER
jgi:hypothetical protein